jgi:hypothetical protein
LIINGFTQISGDTATFSNLDGGEIDRVFHVDPLELGIDVEIRGFVIRHGATIGLPGGPNPDGGAVLNQGTLGLYVHIEASRVRRAGLGGGIYNSGTLDLNGVSVTSSSAAQDGGGVYNAGDMSVIDSAFGGNSTELGSGGGIYNAGSASVAESFINGNLAHASGGGFYNAGTLTLTKNNVNGNQAGSHGGGIENTGTITVTDSTISNNSAAFSGGGVSNAGSDIGGDPRGTATLANSTISGNTGGGIGTGGGLSMLNVTIASNTGRGLLTSPFSGETVRNTIIAANSGGDCQIGPGLISEGNNLDSDGTCTLNGPGDISSVNPLLEPLADNGGPTQTHALLAGSPAIDTADNAACLPTDQRSAERPRDGNADGLAVCDIGAFELEGPPPTPCPEGVEGCGSVTIIKDSIPDSANLVAFAVTNTPCPPFPCQGFTFNLDDDNSSIVSKSTSFPMGARTIHVQETVVGIGWTLTAIACTDDSRTDLSSRTTFIDVAFGEHVTCTFTNVRDAGAPVALPPTGGSNGASKPAALAAAALAMPALTLSFAIGRRFARRVFTRG